MKADRFFHHLGRNAVVATSTGGAMLALSLAMMVPVVSVLTAVANCAKEDREAYRRKVGQAEAAE